MSLPGISMAGGANVAALRMANDQLPGLLFCLVLRTGPDGTLYLAESLKFGLTSTPLFQANWFPASPKLVQWLQAR